MYPSNELMCEIIEVCGTTGIAGGATYDAFIGRIAAHHNATLLTLDRRALTIYERLGIDAELLST
jgi:hypothetical protein